MVGAMRIFVMGGAGFIGSHLVDRLLAEGHAVDVVDDLSRGSLGNLADARRATGELKFHHLDATSDDLDSLVGRRAPEVVYQLALLPRGPAGPPDHGRAFEGALTTLEAARHHGVARVVVALPASALYGQPAVSALPVKEVDFEPRGVRGVVARAVVDLLATYRERHMIEFSALALASVYGPRQRADAGVVAAFRQALEAGVAPTLEGDGRQTRDFVFIDDVVDALVRAGERSSGLVINIGTGEQTQVREVWERLSGGVGPTPQIAPARPDELARFAVSPVRARIHLGWSAWTDLDTGLARLRAEQPG
jgi:UDP-glucose 4-epimerase